MRTLALVIVVGGVIAGGVGCRAPHMGENHGKRLRAAMRAQTARQGDGAVHLDAVDARLVLKAHRPEPAPPPPPPPAQPFGGD